MLKIDQNTGKNLGFKSLLSETIAKKYPERIMKIAGNVAENSYEMLRGAKMGNLITEGTVTPKEAEKFLADQYFAGRTDYIEGVNKTLSESFVRKIYGIQ